MQNKTSAINTHKQLEEEEEERKTELIIFDIPERQGQGVLFGCSRTL